MSYQIERDEGTAARRRVPMRLFTSDGTSPDTGASGDSVIIGINSATTFVPDLLLVASHAAQGMYYAELSASNVSVLGTHPLYHTQGSFPQHVATIQVVNNNPFSLQSNQDLSLKTVKAVNSNVTIAPAAYSGVTVGIDNMAANTLTAAAINADAFTAAKFAADVTTELQAGLATSASITALDGKVTIIDGIVDDILLDTAEIGAAGAGLTNINLPNQTMDIVGNITGNLSGSVGSVTGAVGSVTGAVGSVGAGGIAAASFAAGAVDAAAISADAGAEIADALLNRNMATGTDSGSETVRTVRQALRALRNKAGIAAGTLTVTKEDDTAASWTAAVTTAAGNPISEIDPASS